MITRVDVWAGDGKTHLGNGELVGKVDVWYFIMPDLSLMSLGNCEQRPPDDMVTEMEAGGAALYKSEGNPKIVLDDGTIKYGCQVWWKPMQIGETIK